MLVVYVIEIEVREVDEMLYLMQSPRFKYVSYRQTTSQDRLAVMYTYEMKKIYRKYKILENVNLKDKMLENIKDKLVTL